VSPVTRRLGTAGAIVMIATVLWMTLTPENAPPAVLDFWCIACGQLGGVDVIANIVMFAPVGFMLAGPWRKPWRMPVLTGRAGGE